jgi:glycerol-3-phosphate cytidylyltransferase
MKEETSKVIYEVGLFPMCADILHAGHILALEEAKKHCNVLIVALNTHPDGKNPVQSVFERYTQLCAVKWVDRVVPYQGKVDMEQLCSSLDYQVRFLGEDYINKDWDGKAQETERGIIPFFISRKHGFSSTELKERIIKN